MSHGNIRRRLLMALSGVGIVMLVLGFAAGFVVGQGEHPAPAHASGMNGGLVIYQDGSVVACTPVIGCSSQPAGTCTVAGDSETVQCHFAVAPHSGGALQQDNAECFVYSNVSPEGGYFTTFNSHIVYAPSGQVEARCIYDQPIKL